LFESSNQITPKLLDTWAKLLHSSVDAVTNAVNSIQAQSYHLPTPHSTTSPEPRQLSQHLEDELMLESPTLLSQSISRLPYNPSSSGSSLCSVIVSLCLGIRSHVLLSPFQLSRPTPTQRQSSRSQSSNPQPTRMVKEIFIHRPIPWNRSINNSVRTKKRCSFCCNRYERGNFSSGDLTLVSPHLSTGGS
jgi:hypothetical protein